jgi:hypothetical protein
MTTRQPHASIRVVASLGFIFLRKCRIAAGATSLRLFKSDFVKKIYFDVPNIIRCCGNASC